jgi:predicted Zn-dependent peptidase
MSYWQQGVFTIAASLPTENIEPVERAIVQHLQRLHEVPITTIELERVQTQVANRYVFGSESPSDLAGLYGYYQTLTGQLHHALVYPAKIQRLTPQDIQVAAQTYLSTQAYCALHIVPSVCD